MHRCAPLVQNARDGGVAAASGRWRRRKGGRDYYDVVLIQVGKQAQHAVSCRGTDAQSIRSLVSDKAWDCGRLHRREEWMGGGTHGRFDRPTER